MSRIDDLLLDLLSKDYWDVQLLGKNIGILQLRQQWDLETCHQIRDAIINALGNQKTPHDAKNGQIVHLLDGYIKDLELLDRLMPTSGISNKEILGPAVKDVLKRLYQIREAKP